MKFEPSLYLLEQQRHTHVNPDAAIHTKRSEEERTLTSDQLGTLHNVSVRMVDGDFESCNKKDKVQLIPSCSLHRFVQQASEQTPLETSLLF